MGIFATNFRIGIDAHRADFGRRGYLDTWMHEETVEIPMYLPEWEDALARFDAGDRAPLAGLLSAYLADPEKVARFCSGHAPADVRQGIVEIILGTRKPDGRGKRKAAVRDDDRAEALRELSYLRERRAAVLAVPLKELPNGWKRKRIRFEYDKAVEACAMKYGVDRDTLEAWAKPSRVQRTK